jgi:hypothetical protein
MQWRPCRPQFMKILRATWPPLHRGQPPEILKAVQAGVMAVAPAGLQGVTADDIKTIKLKAFRSVGHRRPDNVAKNVRFPAAGRTGAAATKDLQVQIRFGVVIPLNGNLVPDLLNVRRLQRHRMTMLAGCWQEHRLLALCARRRYSLLSGDRFQRVSNPHGLTDCKSMFHGLPVGVRRKWRCPHGGGLRLLQRQQCNHLSFPSKGVAI